MTKQTKQWATQFGHKYTDRNLLTVKEMDQEFNKQHGMRRTKLNRLFLDDIDHSIKILEVGTNIGNQLLCLQGLGFSNLYGIELQRYAIKLAKTRTENIHIIQSSASNIAFKDNQFELVFTSGLLIHINPNNIESILKEI